MRTAPAVAVVNEAFVRKYLDGLRAARTAREDVRSSAKTDMEIVGVVKDAVYETLRAPAPPTVYASYLQMTGRPMTLVIDARGPVADVTGDAACRHPAAGAGERRCAFARLPRRSTTACSRSG